MPLEPRERFVYLQEKLAIVLYQERYDGDYPAVLAICILIKTA